MNPYSLFRILLLPIKVSSMPFFLAAASFGLGLLSAGQSARAGRKATRAADEQKVAQTELFEAQEEGFREDLEDLIASQRVGFAKSGVKRKGTVLRVLQETRAQGEKEALRIRKSGRAAARATFAQGKAVAAGHRATATQSLLGGAIDFFKATRPPVTTGNTGLGFSGSTARAGGPR